MKKIMIIVAAVLLLAGAVITAAKWLAIDSAETAGAAEEEEQLQDESIFIDMDTLALPVIQGDQVAGTIQIQIKLETVGLKNAVFLQHRLTIISDAFVKDLYGFVPRLLKEKERLDVIILKHRLKMIADRLLGKGYIDDVLVQSVIETPAQ